VWQSALLIAAKDIGDTSPSAQPARLRSSVAAMRFDHRDDNFRLRAGSKLFLLEATEHAEKAGRSLAD
jgi:hypothetical protein